MITTSAYVERSEAALDAVLKRWIAREPDKAEHFRLYFAKKRPLLLNLARAVWKRQQAAPPGATFETIGRAALSRLRDVLMQKNTAEVARAFAQWFADNDPWLMKVARAIAKELASPAAPPLPPPTTTLTQLEDRWQETADRAAAGYDALRAAQPTTDPAQVAAQIRQAFPINLYSRELPLLLAAVEGRKPNLRKPAHEALLRLDGAGVLGALSVLYGDQSTPPDRVLSAYLRKYGPEPVFRVALEAVGDAGPGRLSWENANSLTEARESVFKFIARWRLGAHNLGPAAGRVTLDGHPYAQISYIGRIWKVDSDWQKTGQELNEEGQEIFVGAPRPVIGSSAVQAPPPADVAALPDDSELWGVKERTEANISAIEIIEAGGPRNDAERRAVRLYSGMGGLSLKSFEKRIPREWLPELQGLVHEYYTPMRLAREVARVVRMLLEPLLTEAEGPLLALEPAAGVGRFIDAMSGPGFERLKWTAVEYSHVSARILQAARPDITVFQGPFEAWVAENEAAVGGRIGLVVSNPPYGKRGGTVTLDPAREYREKMAYPYFVRRGGDLLRPGGIAVYLIPYGFLTSTKPDFVELRRKVLLRHHLLAAFRLPSALFPGANLVTDLLFFEARGGELKEILADDKEILDGHYFALYPTHVLGTVIGEQTGDDSERITKKARFGFEIAGEFTVLPPFSPRPVCRTCWVEPWHRTRAAKEQGPRREDLPAHVQSAVTLGDRVAEYLRHYGASADSESAKTAAALYGELRDALHAWRTAHAESGLASPWADPKIQKSTRDFPELVSFLSAFEQSGSLAPAFAVPPRYEPKYAGSLEDVVAQAAFLWSTRRRFTTETLGAFRKEIGATAWSVASLESALYAAGWCLDQGAWVPERDYYTGNLWPKYEAAKRLGDAGDANAARQAGRLYRLINPPPLSEITPEPRMPFVPVGVLQQWLQAFTLAEVPALDRESGLLKLAGQPYSAVEEEADSRLRTAFGYLNHDLSLFQLKYVKQQIPELKREETASEALDRVRLEYGKKAIEHFGAWLRRNKEAARELEAAYAGAFKGYILPVFEPHELDIARWRGDFKLRPHQRVGAWRLLFHGGGLLSFDVGVGKTLTGIAVAAYLRQQGRARRIMCVLPNSIMLKWEKDIKRALPDYRVLLIGVEKYRGRSGVWRSRTDTEQERALKYRQFQAGEYDIALVTYSMFGRTGLRADTLRRFVAASPPLQRELGLRTRNQMVDFESEAAKRDASAERKAKKSGKPKLASVGAVRRIKGVEAVDKASPSELQAMRIEVAQILAEQRAAEHDQLAAILDSAQDVSERNRAVFSLEVDRWIAEKLEEADEDTGPSWEDLKVDLLIVDEAQNFKNLWTVQPREGGLPKFLGAIQEGSDRAWNLAMRAFEVRERNGGSGVVLLSATPAKNSPLEYFTLLGYVDTDAWTRLGITSPEVFIDRYLRLEERLLIQPDLKQKKGLVVAGFKLLNELRDIVFRYAEFRTAPEVGLKLPPVERETITVPMLPEQRRRYSFLVSEYVEALKRAGSGDAKSKHKALGLFHRMGSVSLHYELELGPASETKPRDEDNEAADLTGEALADALALAGLTPADEVPESSGKKAARPGWTWRNARLAKNFASPKITEAARLGASNPDCGHIYFVEPVAVHYWLQQELIRAGVPEERIAVLNAETAPTAQHRQNIAEKFNGVPPIYGPSGELEIEGTPPQFDHVIANSIANEGIDLQIRTCDAIHLDLPWEPATLQQRNGRAVRQGNTRAVIRIVYLLSEQSTDALRLQMIQGKLGWMKDMLESADRETNNPIANTEMSLEEMLLYVSSEPAQAEKAMAELRRQQDAQRDGQTRKTAWSLLRSLSIHAQNIREESRPDKLAAEHASLDEVKTRLAQIPAEVWRWGFVASLVERGIPIALRQEDDPAQSFPLWEGARFNRDKIRFEIGRIEGDVVGLRKFGEVWYREMDLSAESWASGHGMPGLHEALQGATEADFSRWPEDEDRTQVTEEMERRTRRGHTVPGVSEFVRFAHEPWRTWLWETWGAQIVASLKIQRAGALEIPALDESGKLILMAAPALPPGAQVIPFTEPGWQAYLAGASKWTKGWTDLNAVADRWWGRPFPRGILAKRGKDEEEADWLEVQGAEGRERVRVVWRSKFFAVHRPLDGEDQNGDLVVTHVPSELAAGVYPSLDRAQLAVRYLEALPVAWEDKKPAIAQAANISSALTRIKTDTTLPALEALLADSP